MLSVADDQVAVGLVPSAVASSSIGHWMPTGKRYPGAARRANMAAQSGIVRGVIWHQGERNARGNESESMQYAKRLAFVIRQVRRDFSDPRLPFVVGELGDFLSADEYPHADLINAALHKVVDLVPDTAIVSSDGLTSHDGVHFDTESTILLGHRYAEAMQELQAAQE